MISNLLQLFRARGVRVISSQAFGPPLDWKQVQGAFVQAKDSPMWQALGQVALALREECVQQAKAATAAEKTSLAALHQGGEDACAEFAQMLLDLSEGRVPDSVKQWFPEKSV